MRLISCIISVFMFLSISHVTQAQVALVSEHSEKFKPVIDGRLTDWIDDKSGVEIGLFTLGRGEWVGGKVPSSGREDISAEYALVHNRNALFVGIVLKDERLIRTKKMSLSDDHIELWFGVSQPGSGQVEPFGMAIFMNPDDDKNSLEARSLSSAGRKVGKKVQGVNGALAINLDNYSLEMRIPWSVLPKGVDSRLGLRAALYIVDNDSEENGDAETILGTLPFTQPISLEDMPLLTQSDLTAPLQRFWKDAKMRSTRVPHFTYVSNLVGDDKLEQLVFAGNYVMAYGGAIDAPKTYVSFRLPVHRSSQIVDKQLIDLTGDGKDEIIVQFEQDTGTSTRRWMSIYQITDNLRFSKIFSAATLVSDGIVRIENKFKFVKGKGKTRAILFTPAIAQGVDRSTLGEELPAEGGNTMVVPWDKPPKRKYVFYGGSFIQEYRGMR